MTRSVVLLCMLLSTIACKNNGANSSSSKKTEKTNMTEAGVPAAKKIIVDAQRGQAAKADYSVLSWAIKDGDLEVVVRYSGGCEEHDFDAYFSGGWLKSLPPQAMVELEHLDPNNDACRGLVKDTFLFDASVLQYPGAEEVVVKWATDPSKMANYHYGKKEKE